MRNEIKLCKLVIRSCCIGYGHHLQWFKSSLLPSTYSSSRSLFSDYKFFWFLLHEVVLQLITHITWWNIDAIFSLKKSVLLTCPYTMLLWRQFNDCRKAWYVALTARLYWRTESEIDMLAMKICLHIYSFYILSLFHKIEWKMWYARYSCIINSVIYIVVIIHQIVS